MVKAAPLIEAEVTVTAEVPVDVKVTDCVVGEFSVTLPKFRLEVLTVNCGFAAAVPVPLSATTAVLPVVELLLMVTCPVAAPGVVGLNWICSVTDWVGFNVIGRLPATMVKAAPLIDAELTVTGEAPVDVSVTDCVVGEFTVTLPKLKLAVLAVSCGFVADGPTVAPTPLRATTAVPPVIELLLMVSWPAAAPPRVG